MSDQKEEAFVTFSDVQEKVSRLEELLPGKPEEVYAFARLLAERLSEEANVLGFFYRAEFLINDLQREYDEIHNRPLSGPLVRASESTYALIRRSLPEVVEVFFGKDVVAEIQNTRAQFAQHLPEYSSIPVVQLSGLGLSDGPGKN